jgi:hypothetical protein
MSPEPARASGWRARAAPPLAAVLAAACMGGGEPPSTSPNARPELVETLRADLEAPRHASDGGGRATLESVEGPVVAGGPARFDFLFEAGPLGIADGGHLFFQVSPFWGWSTPQVVAPDEPGFTTVASEAEGIRLEPETAGAGLLAIAIRGRALAQGERIRIVYGAGPARARVDRFAERESPFWFGVDGDADGVRGLLARPPVVDVGPAAPARLSLTLTSTARPGGPVRLHVAVLDAAGNAGPAFEGVVRLSVPPGLRLPASVRLGSGQGARAAVEGAAAAEGVHRVEAEAAGGLSGRSNPLVVSADGPNVLWGDLHGHSQISDGTGTSEDYYVYARDVAGLDVVALTDHDHWGLRPLAQAPDLWERIRRASARFNDPGRFVALLGYEWTSWIHGHRHVLYFGDEGRVFDSVDARYESPLQLWAALRGQPALTFAHHSAGGPIATNWAIPPDPVLEPVTEIASVHGSSEAPDAPRLIYDGVDGNFVRDALSRGYRLGFIGSGDGHDGHPGLAALASPSGGLAAILAERPTREAVLEALRARRVYATNGPRIVLRASLAGHPMGATVAASGGPDWSLDVHVVAEAPLERLDLVRGGGVVETIPGGGRTELRLSRTVAPLRAREYLYVRAVQEDGGAAWSSPFFGGP